MGGTYGQFMMDAERERGGIWVDYGQAGRFLVARAGGENEDFTKALERLTKQHRKTIDLGLLDRAVGDKIIRQAYAEAVIRDWENVTGPGGEPLPHTVENAVRLFTDLPVLFEALIEDSKNVALFRKALREEAAKNS